MRISDVILEAVEGDLTTQDTDAIVNAANHSLLGGGGVDGAIHRAAGPELVAECATLNGCMTGDAKITRGYRLKADFVIHTVGPVYAAESRIVPFLLASAYRRSLEVAAASNLNSIAFPAISTGVFGYPIHEAANIAVGTCAAFAAARISSIRLVRFVLFSDDVYTLYTRTLAAFSGEAAGY